MTQYKIKGTALLYWNCGCPDCGGNHTTSYVVDWKGEAETQDLAEYMAVKEFTYKENQIDTGWTWVEDPTVIEIKEDSNMNKN